MEIKKEHTFISAHKRRMNMHGVYVKKIDLVHEDDRRSIWEVMNGQLSIKNIKIIKIKKGEQLLGNHWHAYSEVMYMMQGKAKYKMRHVITGEEEDYNLEEGDVMFRTGFLTHAGFFEEDSIIIDGAAESYLGSDFNDVVEKIL